MDFGHEMYSSYDRLWESKNKGFLINMEKIKRDSENKKNIWVEWLKEGGIKGAHPDDGWHNREECYFSFSYPYFNNGVDIGDMVALGDYNKFRIFIVRDIKKTMFGKYKYYY